MVSIEIKYTPLIHCLLYLLNRNDISSRNHSPRLDYRRYVCYIKLYEKPLLAFYRLAKITDHYSGYISRGESFAIRPFVFFAGKSFAVQNLKNHTSPAWLHVRVHAHRAKALMASLSFFLDLLDWLCLNDIWSAIVSEALL